MTVGVIFGGNSTEYEVSCASVVNVLENMDFCQVKKIGITRDGKWFLTQASTKEIRSLTWDLRSDNLPVFADLAHKCFFTDKGLIELDVVFPVLHGKNGEDGTVQGLLECLEIPYVGSDTLSSALCMSKEIANRIFTEAGIAHTPWFSFSSEEWKESESAVLLRTKTFSFPVFVKPSAAGSSVGISCCRSLEEVPAAVEQALTVDDIIIIEQGIENVTELEVAVLGNGPKAKAFGPGQVVSAESFYSYSSKYENTSSHNQIPADIPAEKAEEIRHVALEAYRVCRCRGLARVDFFLTPEGEILLNEVNTLPGFTSISMYPQLLTQGGLTYSQLLEELLKSATCS